MIIIILVPLFSLSIIFYKNIFNIVTKIVVLFAMECLIQIQYLDHTYKKIIKITCTVGEILWLIYYNYTYLPIAVRGEMIEFIWFSL